MPQDISLCTVSMATLMFHDHRCQQSNSAPADFTVCHQGSSCVLLCVIDKHLRHVERLIQLNVLHAGRLQLNVFCAIEI